MLEGDVKIVAKAMSFDAYHRWLGIPPAEQPANHYRLLGVALFESDHDVLESAADRQMAHVRTFQAGPHSALSQKVLNELAAAKLCLLTRQDKAAYDLELRRKLDAAKDVRPVEPMATPMPAAAGLQVVPGPLAEAAPVQIIAHDAVKPRATRKQKAGRGRLASAWIALAAVAVPAFAFVGYLISNRPRPESGRKTASSATADERSKRQSGQARSEPIKSQPAMASPPSSDGEQPAQPSSSPVAVSPPSEPPSRAPSVRPAAADLAFETWVKDVRSMPAEKQVEAVAKKLQEMNPGFDGQVTHKIENGVVIEFGFVPENMDRVVRIAPVSALNGLKSVTCRGTFKQFRDASDNTRAPLTDLSPLAGMSLSQLNISSTRVSDISPLKGMPLTMLACMDTPIADLSPLRGMPLTQLACASTEVADLAPLRGLPLASLVISNTKVRDISPLTGMALSRLFMASTDIRDLSPLRGMNLESLYLSSTPVADLSPLAGIPLKRLWAVSTKVTDFSPLLETSLEYLDGDVQSDRDGAVLRSIKTLAKINNKPVTDFWKEVGNAPATPTTVPSPSPSEAAVALLSVAKKTVYPGEADVVPVRIARNGYNGPVSVSLQGLPKDFKAGSTTIPAGQLRAVIDLEIPQHAPTATAEIRVVASFEKQSIDKTFELTVRKRPPVRPFEVPLNGLAGQTSMKPISFGPDWLGFNKLLPTDPYLARGFFARPETRETLGYPTIPVSRYVFEIELEVLRPADGAGTRICLGDPWCASHLPLYWDKNRNKSNLVHQIWRYGGWGWAGGRDFDVGERLALKLIVLDGRQVLCLRNKPILSLEDAWPADLTLRICSEATGGALIHRCSCRELREEDVEAIDSPMPEAELHLDAAAAKARIESLRKGLPIRPVSGKTFVAGRSRSPMAWIAPGEYRRGSADGPTPSRHRVKITQGFWIGRLEVTQEEWSALMPSNPSRIKGSPCLPVDWVTWQDAMAFCEKLNQLESKGRRLPQGYIYRLPTDAEWEYACRAGSDEAFSIPQHEVLSREHSGRCPHEVGEKSANAWGLFDMHGNAMEWCLDGWHEYPKDTAVALVDPYHPGRPNDDPFVVRGGAWWTGEGACRSHWRDRNHSSPAGGYRGFRLVLGPSLTPTAN